MDPSYHEKFNSSILRELTDILDLVKNVKSAAGLQWLISLLFKVTNKDKEATVAEIVVSLLKTVSDELLKRSNPYHLLLRERYGLYGTPLEPQLFDIELPLYSKGEKSPSYLLTTNNNNNGEIPNPASENLANYSFNRENINPKDVFSSSASKLHYKYVVSSFKFIRGLIETEPLHFSCVAASDGTRVERADATSKYYLIYN